MTIRHKLYRLVHGHVKGVSTLANEMGLGYQTLTNKLNTNNDSHHVSIAELEMVGDFLDVNIEIASYFADKGNAVVVTLPHVEQYGDMNLLDSFMQCVESHGEIGTAFKEAFADGDVDRDEYEAIRQDMYTAISDLLAFLKLIEGMVR